jgi:nitrogenase molybdenum-iron protein alpha/beta subunit
MIIYLNEFRDIQMRSDDLLPENERLNKFGPSYRGKLEGKVVMLIADDAASVRDLIYQLAELGADIALVCAQTSYDVARIIKEKVEELGLRFHYFEAGAGKKGSAEYTIQSVLAWFGHIDVFIDLSAQKGRSRREASRLAAASFPMDWDMMEAALRAIAR